MKPKTINTVYWISTILFGLTGVDHSGGFVLLFLAKA